MAVDMVHTLPPKLREKGCMYVAQAKLQWKKEIGWDSVHEVIPFIVGHVNFCGAFLEALTS